MREHPEVRLNRRTFSETWEVVRLAKDGRTITDRWPIHADDAAKLDAAFADALVLADPNPEVATHTHTTATGHPANVAVSADKPADPSP